MLKGIVGKDPIKACIGKIEIRGIHRQKFRSAFAGSIIESNVTSIDRDCILAPCCERTAD